MHPQDYNKIVLQEKYVIDLREQLGNGSYGYVHKGYMYGRENEQIAVKLIDKNQLQRRMNDNNRILNYIQRERRNQQQLQGPNIVKMIDYIEDNEYFYFFLEYCEQGNLERKTQSGIPKQEVFQILKQIVQGYKEIYDKRIIHRDLKPENILFSRGIAKIADFGFSKTLDELSQNVKQTNLGTPQYMAPEIIRHENYSSKADVWSLGVILYKMLYGCTTFEMRSQYQNRTTNEFEVHYPNDIVIPEKYLALLKKMLTENQEQRISWEEIFFEILEEFQEIQQILLDTNIKVNQILKYFFYILDILKFLRQVMREVQDIIQIISLSQEQQLHYSIITQKYILNELSFYMKVLNGQNMFDIYMLNTDFQLFQKDERYKVTRENFQQNYNLLRKYYDQTKAIYENFQQSSQRITTEQVQFLLPDCTLILNSDKNNQEFGETFNKIYHNIIEHIRYKLNIQTISTQQKQSLLKVLIKLIYCLQPLQFSHIIFEPKDFENQILNSQSLEIQFNMLYQKFISQVT